MALCHVQSAECQVQSLENRGQDAKSELRHIRPSALDTTISIITCYPGPEIYELCGHSAIRVRGAGIDSVWNYGIFDFNQPNFVYRFVKGETDYKGMAYPFSWFLPEYENRGSRVVEQDLNLTPEETKQLLEILRESVRPENALYRYNYVKDNCSTRILGKLDGATTEKIIYPDSVRYGTFRNEMRAYHEGYPWYQFGIDLALGSGLDYKLNSREEMFVPVEMERNLASAKFADGRDVVKATRVLNPGMDNSVLPPTPWYMGPLFWSWIVFIIVVVVVAIDINRKKSFIPLLGVWFTILGLTGCLSFFLVFISVHEATSPNALIFWLNPLQFAFVAGLMFKKLKSLAIAMSYYNLIVPGILLIVSPFLRQSFNPAFFPLMGATVVLGFDYAINCYKKSYKRRKKRR